MIGDRKELEENLIETMNIHKLKTKKNIVDDIKNELRKYKVINAQNWINKPKTEIPNLENRELFLLTEQIYLKTGDSNINPYEYFTEQEMKKSRQYVGTYELEEEIKFPITLDGFIKLSHNEYSGTMSADLVAKLAMSRKLHYNFEVQREPVKRTVGKSIVTEAKLIMQNVLEIKDHLKNNTLKPTQLVFNAAIGTADYGEEDLIYDELEKKLTVSNGVILEIIDGFHRTKGTELAFFETGHVNFTFPVLITNYDTDEARQFQGQIAKQTPIAKERAQELRVERMADAILKELIPKSELRGRVASGRRIVANDKELVSYSILADTIEEKFKIEKMVDVYKVSNYLVKLFNYLIGTFEEEFNNNKESIMASNNIFIGYIIIGKKLMDENRDPSEIVNIVNKIDFNRNNPLWEKLGILNKQGVYDNTNKSRLAIKKYFEEMEI